MAKKYRTKSGKVEEKLPGINATVSPSEKVQIAMAGGADTLKDVQDILGQQGKRNNLKGQGAKHLVSFFTQGMGYEGMDDPEGRAGVGGFGGSSSTTSDSDDTAPSPTPATTDYLKTQMDNAERQDRINASEGFLKDYIGGQSPWSRATEAYKNRLKEEEIRLEQGYEPAPRESTFSKTGNKARGTNLRSASDAATSPEKTLASPLEPGGKAYDKEKHQPDYTDYSDPEVWKARSKKAFEATDPDWIDRAVRAVNPMDNWYDLSKWKAANLALTGSSAVSLNIPGVVAGVVKQAYLESITSWDPKDLTPMPGLTGLEMEEFGNKGYDWKPTPTPDDGGTEKPACPRGSTKSASGICLPITSNNTTLAVVNEKDTRATRSQLRNRTTRQAY
jgi:hypothetical protein